ncbi:MAG TPA: STAS domain-containing protein [Anaerolineales bacterium]|nr:STAS domain-containing protein [Anaerolineales bacterium]
MDGFSITSERKEDITIVTVSGRVDSATSKTMDAELEKLIPTDKKVVLNLKNVEFLSSAGVRAIVKALKTAKKTRGGLKLASIPDHIAEILQTLGMMELMEAYPSVEEAIASF